VFGFPHPLSERTWLHEIVAGAQKPVAVSDLGLQGLPGNPLKPN
jgi:hypothetical protein